MYFKSFGPRTSEELSDWFAIFAEALKNLDLSNVESYSPKVRGLSMPNLISLQSKST